MALYPNNFTTQFKLQPGARGEKFKTNMPGYRSNEDRINRTNIRLNMNEHDTPNIAYMFDDRLPALFKYGFAVGFNNIVIPKGRICATDKYMDLVDFDTQKKANTLTLANGGAPVRLRTSSDLYKNYSGAAEKMVSTEAQGAKVANADLEWIPLIGMEAAYSDVAYRPFKTNGPAAQLTAAGFEIDPQRGRVIQTSSGKVADVIPGNIPTGILIRNEYTRDEDAFNGMAPGAINTNCMVELPWFAYKDKAEENPWGSAYGGLFPGALVKSDENGRVVVSPLSFETEVASMKISEYELERQQVIGQVYGVNTEMVPMGAAKWATWALSDRLDFEEFEPEVYAQNGRRGEDAVAHTPYHATVNGYPYDKNYGNSDLHMLQPGRDNYDIRMEQQYIVEDLGIPGLTDGYNAVKREYEAIEIGKINLVKGMTEKAELLFKLPEVKVEDIQVGVGSKSSEVFVNAVEGAKVGVTINGSPVANALTVTYVDELQGLVRLQVTDLVALNKALASVEDPIKVPVYVTFAKRGLAGVPTFMDWSGCVGSVKILLQK